VPGNNTVTTGITTGDFTVVLDPFVDLTGYCGGLADAYGNVRFVLITNDTSGCNMFLEGRVRVSGATILGISGKLKGYLVPISGPIEYFEGTFGGEWESFA
jgi:hypothetical protein